LIDFLGSRFSSKRLLPVRLAPFSAKAKPPNLPFTAAEGHFRVELMGFELLISSQVRTLLDNCG
jgi:hypothetical protein